MFKQGGVTFMVKFDLTSIYMLSGFILKFCAVFATARLAIFSNTNISYFKHYFESGKPRDCIVIPQFALVILILSRYVASFLQLCF
jgi:hypothetical protein